MELKIRLEAGLSALGYPALFLVAEGNGKILKEPYDGAVCMDVLFEHFKDSAQPDSGYRPIMPAEPAKRTFEGPFAGQPSVVMAEGIQERDVVKCVNLSRRDDGLVLTVGKEYTVIKKIRMKDPEAGPGERKFITILEVLDVDHGRIQVYESDMEFVRHNEPAQAPKYDKYEETRVCDKCRQNYSVWKPKTGGEYQGECPCANEVASGALIP